jgi:hypothetical protein
MTFGCREAGEQAGCDAQVVPVGMGWFRAAACRIEALPRRASPVRQPATRWLVSASICIQAAIPRASAAIAHQVRSGPGHAAAGWSGRCFCAAVHAAAQGLSYAHLVPGLTSAVPLGNTNR